MSSIRDDSNTKGMTETIRNSENPSLARQPTNTRSVLSTRSTEVLKDGTGISDSLSNAADALPPPTTRSRTLWEKQPYMLAYGAAISIFSPTATAYQLCKLYKIRPATSQLVRLSISIFPHQTILKTLQMNVSTPVKEHLNPWAAFAVVGVLQGGVYGQANVSFANALKVGKVASMAGVFRGVGFAGVRDTISQGVPFMCSRWIREHTLDQWFPTSADAEEDATMRGVKQWTSVISTSIVATYMSQGLHNCQTTMQADQSLSYVQAVRKVFTQHGAMGLVRGGEARVGLLLIVNILNELLLKPAWAPVPIES